MKCRNVKNYTTFDVSLAYFFLYKLNFRIKFNHCKIRLNVLNYQINNNLNKFYNFMKILYIKLLMLIIFTQLFYNCSDSIVESTPSVDENENQNQEIILPNFSEIQEKIFNQSCALSGCHAGAANPNLSNNSYERIVNKQSSSGANYIEPGDPDNSYLLQKVLGSNISGSRMPLNSSALSQNKIDALVEWINNGAQNN